MFLLYKFVCTSCTNLYVLDETLAILAKPVATSPHLFINIFQTCSPSLTLLPQNFKSNLKKPYMYILNGRIDVLINNSSLQIIFFSIRRSFVSPETILTWQEVCLVKQFYSARFIFMESVSRGERISWRNLIVAELHMSSQVKLSPVKMPILLDICQMTGC